LKNQKKMKTVRVIYIVPKDRQFQYQYYNAIAGGIKDMCEWFYLNFFQQKTFKMPKHIEIIQSSKTSQEFQPQGDDTNAMYVAATKEVEETVGYPIYKPAKDSDEIFMIFIDIPMVGRGWNSVAVVARIDMDGLRLKFGNPVSGQFYDKYRERWISGIAHEFGHTLGLDHPLSTDPLYPKKLMGNGFQQGRTALNSILTPEEKKIILDSGFFTESQVGNSIPLVTNNTWFKYVIQKPQPPSANSQNVIQKPQPPSANSQNASFANPQPMNASTTENIISYQVTKNGPAAQAVPAVPAAQVVQAPSPVSEPVFLAPDENVAAPTTNYSLQNPVDQCALVVKNVQGANFLQCLIDPSQYLLATLQKPQDIDGVTNPTSVAHLGNPSTCSIYAYLQNGSNIDALLDPDFSAKYQASLTQCELSKLEYQRVLKRPNPKYEECDRSKVCTPEQIKGKTCDYVDFKASWTPESTTYLTSAYDVPEALTNFSDTATLDVTKEDYPRPSEFQVSLLTATSFTIQYKQVKWEDKHQNTPALQNNSPVGYIVSVFPRGKAQSRAKISFHFAHEGPPGANAKQITKRLENVSGDYYDANGKNPPTAGFAISIQTLSKRNTLSLPVFIESLKFRSSPPPDLYKDRFSLRDATQLVKGTAFLVEMVATPSPKFEKIEVKWNFKVQEKVPVCDWFEVKIFHPESQQWLLGEPVIVRVDEHDPLQIEKRERELCYAATVPLGALMWENMGGKMLEIVLYAAIRGVGKAPAMISAVPLRQALQLPVNPNKRPSPKLHAPTLVKFNFTNKEQWAMLEIQTPEPYGWDLYTMVLETVRMPPQITQLPARVKDFLPSADAEIAKKFCEQNGLVFETDWEKIVVPLSLFFEKPLGREEKLRQMRTTELCNPNTCWKGVSTQIVTVKGNQALFPDSPIFVARLRARYVNMSYPDPNAVMPESLSDPVMLALVTSLKSATNKKFLSQEEIASRMGPDACNFNVEENPNIIDIQPDPSIPGAKIVSFATEEQKTFNMTSCTANTPGNSADPSVKSSSKKSNPWLSWIIIGCVIFFIFVIAAGLSMNFSKKKI
jgi:hypothetical protein